MYDRLPKHRNNCRERKKHAVMYTRKLLSSSRVDGGVADEERHVLRALVAQPRRRHALDEDLDPDEEARDCRNVGFG